MLQNEACAWGVFLRQSQ